MVSCVRHAGSTMRSSTCTCIYCRSGRKAFAIDIGVHFSCTKRLIKEERLKKKESTVMNMSSAGKAPRIYSLTKKLSCRLTFGTYTGFCSSQTYLNAVSSTCNIVPRKIYPNACFHHMLLFECSGAMIRYHDIHLTECTSPMAWGSISLTR